MWNKAIFRMLFDASGITYLILGIYCRALASAFKLAAANRTVWREACKGMVQDNSCDGSKLRTTLNIVIQQTKQDWLSCDTASWNCKFQRPNNQVKQRKLQNAHRCLRHHIPHFLPPRFTFRSVRVINHAASMNTTSEVTGICFQAATTRTVRRETGKGFGSGHHVWRKLQARNQVEHC